MPGTGGDAVLDAVTLYADRNFSGAAKALGKGRHDRADFRNIGDNNISSLRVKPGWKVTLYDLAGCTGSSKVFEHDAADLGDFDQKTSSLTVEPISQRLIVAFTRLWVTDDEEYGQGEFTLTMWIDGELVGPPFKDHIGSHRGRDLTDRHRVVTKSPWEKIEVRYTVHETDGADGTLGDKVGEKTDTYTIDSNWGIGQHDVRLVSDEGNVIVSYVISRPDTVNVR